MTDKPLKETARTTMEWGEVEKYIKQAANAFEAYRLCPKSRRANFLRQIAREIGAIRADLVETSHRETHLPEGRLNGEIDRTINQINLFAAVLEEGSWVNAIIDTANPQRTPVPKPDIRQMQLPIGPVCVFGASNFPFAFSVAGGDTISALAAGCPVLYKAHSAHPETSVLVSGCIERAAGQMNMPNGVFAALVVTREVSIQVITHPSVTAVAFTGSFSGGKALYDAAVRRPVPIPVYAEMGSINPVFLLPDRLKHHADATAAGLVASNTMGAGQFCTNPGLMVMLQSPETEQFLAAYGKQLAEQTCHTMLTPGIYDAYSAGIKHLKSIGELSILAEGKTDKLLSDTAVPIAFRVRGTDFLRNSALREEYFGPASIHVIAEDNAELLEIANMLDGQLTAGVWCTDDDIESFSPLFRILERKAGRLMINGAPTGVEVCHAMVHGGPFPATTDARSTSVGTQAIYRFTRPVSFQNYPEKLLPVELRGDNGSDIWRKVDGELTKKSL
ncbi:ketoglutarate semialdehyde dehydrogenase [Parapedobacter pyrenivorans]|uniref:Ketoglutarate semialdehyde dehydrogenase n=1 Tax=Parapedobacter pyrenivorans TaxID=1305674 RepID=A0A917MBK9_9SPHI|nr:aldehyde dehydrogenase (NADP(+)) [Parapedobacter pyrenivorans]GGG92249.1 ketoglutarate semialdehyde dehydrogenase [Parapedobacter pyrenivorans]